MNDSYIPGLTNSMQKYAVGGTVTPTIASSGLTPEDVRASLAAAFGPPQYTPEMQQYIDSVNAYASAQEAPFGSFSSTIPLYSSPSGPAANLKMYERDLSKLEPYMGKPVEQNAIYSFNVPVDSGSPSGYVNVRNDTPIYLINPKTGEVISGGVGFDAAKQVANKARELSVNQGSKANWEIYTGPAGSTDFSQFTRSAVDDPNKGVLGKIGDALKVIAPIAVQFIPGIGQALGFGLKGALGAGVAAGTGAALARTGAGIISGDSVLDSLKAGVTTGALSGLTAGALNGLGVGVGSGMPGGLPNPGQIISATNASLAGTALPGVAGSALGSAAGSIANPLANEILVSGVRNALSGVTGGLGAGAGALANGVLGGAQNIADRLPEVQQGDALGQPGTVVTGSIPTPVDPTAGALGAGVGNVVVPDATINPDEIVVEGRPNVTEDTVLPPLVPFTGDVPLAQTPKLETEVDSGLSTVDKIRLGLLGAGLLGGAAGANDGGTIPGGLGGGRSPIFSAQLPQSNLPVSTPRTASDMGNIDYYRYGYGPEQSFFSNVPQGAPNTSTAYTGYEEREGLARGGQPRSNFAVGGPGDGRSDEIPAMLSDGEYIIDAETVALLGNGSSKAGAKALDSFRVNVRKQKGRKLAKGNFSGDAKRPEQYLKGRK